MTGTGQDGSPRKVTPVTNLRLPLDVKQAAQERCEREGVTLTYVITRYLARWSKAK